MLANQSSLLYLKSEGLEVLAGLRLQSGHYAQPFRVRRLASVDWVRRLVVRLLRSARLALASVF
jgi:hypothetical protein